MMFPGGRPWWKWICHSEVCQSSEVLRLPYPRDLCVGRVYIRQDEILKMFILTLYLGSDQRWNVIMVVNFSFKIY